MAAPALLDCARDATVFCGGILDSRRLDHPEGIFVDPADGSVWCGGEAGQLYRVSPDGKEVREVVCTGGFALGVGGDLRGCRYVCDLAHRCVFVFDRDGRQLACLEGRDGAESLRLPNSAVLSPDQRQLYVSDTRRAGGPGVWRFDLSTGASSLWMRESCLSANGLAMDPAGAFLYLVESHLPGVSRIPIRADGSAGPKQLAVKLPGCEPDGLAFDARGNLFISIYHPSRIYRWRPSDGRLDLVIEDETTDWLHHPTNLAFRGDRELFCTNFGAWHLTRIDLTRLPA